MAMTMMATDCEWSCLMGHVAALQQPLPLSEAKAAGEVNVLLPACHVLAVCSLWQSWNGTLQARLT